MAGTGSAFSGCGVCAGAGDCCFAAAGSSGPAAVCWMLGAIACVTGRADFLVSLLSHATSNIKPALRTKMLKRFTGQLPINTRFPLIIPVCWTSLAAERQHAILGL